MVVVEGEERHVEDCDEPPPNNGGGGGSSTNNRRNFKDKAKSKPKQFQSDKGKELAKHIRALVDDTPTVR